MGTTIGRGTKMSIAKAALHVFYEEYHSSEDYLADNFIYSGEVDLLHKIIDFAGAEHCSVDTIHQVLNCLNISPYWETNGTIQGWQNRKANCYRPSDKGIDFIDKYVDKVKN